MQTERKPDGRIRCHILVGICSCMTMKNKRDAVRETWLKHPAPGIECRFFMGGNEPPPGEEHDTVALQAPDGYHELPAKVLAFFRHALEHYDFDWLFKCDDDTYLNLSRLASAADDGYDLIGDSLIAVRRSPSGGAGYFLKRSMVEKIAAYPRFPACGAEDVIVGELVDHLGGTMQSTRRLYMSNVYYPEKSNDMISAHWCQPPMMRAIHAFNHREPDLICDARHQYWNDKLHFYTEGIFRRQGTSCYGWWSIGGNGELQLKWLQWSTDQLLLQNDVYIGSELSIILPPGRPSLAQLEHAGTEDTAVAADSSSCRHIHLECGGRKFDGWLNLKAPNYDITRALPWEDDSVDAYYLDDAINAVTPVQACRFFTETFRTLKPGGTLRFTFRDVLALRERATPAFRQYMKQECREEHVPDNDMNAIMTAYGHQSLWSEQLLSGILSACGFTVSQCAPGVSSHPHLQNLEQTATGDEAPFGMMGIVCMEALKPGANALSPAESGPECGPSTPSGYICPRFKHAGRTGNILFQIAATYAHALRNGLECRIPWNENEESRQLGEWLKKASSICPDGGYDAPVLYHESSFSYHPIPDEMRNGALEGYFQSERYFPEFGREIRALFHELTARRRRGTAGVHVRMGDYLDKPEIHRTPDVSFLEKAFSRLSGNIRKVVIFSDSPEKALELVRQVPAAGRFSLEVDRHNTLEALRELTAMQELILSCSTFSWWGAYLGNQKKVFIQKKWFSGVIEDDQDICREHWIKL